MIGNGYQIRVMTMKKNKTIKKKCHIVGAAEKKKTKGKKKMDMDFIWHYSSQHNVVSAGDRLLQKSGQFWN